MSGVLSATNTAENQKINIIINVSKSKPVDV